MTVTSCPFCGVATEVAHETQEGCIAALQEEIARVRNLLVQSQLPGEAPRRQEPQDATGPPASDESPS